MHFCPMCFSTESTQAFGDWYVTCSNCGATVSTLTPLPHQAVVLTDPAENVSMFATFSTGKTVIAQHYTALHMMLLKNAFVFAAMVNQELSNQIIFKGLMSIIPRKYILHANNPDTVKEQQTSILLTNKAYCGVYSSNVNLNSSKFRSLQFTFVYLEEASLIKKYDFYMELQTRIHRHSAGLVYELNEDGSRKKKIVENNGERIQIDVVLKDFSRFIMCSNPSRNHFIKTKVLMRSRQIFFRAKKVDNFYIKTQKQIDLIDDTQSVHIQKTEDNPHNAPGYIDGLRKKASPEWIRLNLDADFNTDSGSIIKHWDEVIFEHSSLDIAAKIADPSNLLLATIDYGWKVPTAINIYLYDHVKDCIYMIDECRHTEKSPAQMVEELDKTLEPYGGRKRLSRHLIGDPSGDNSLTNGQKLNDDYLQAGLVIVPAERVPKTTRHSRFEDYCRVQKMFISNKCTGFLEELESYTWDIPKNVDPEDIHDWSKYLPDGNDDGIDSNSYLMTYLPPNPRNLSMIVSQIVYNGQNIANTDKEFVDPIYGGNHSKPQIQDMWSAVNGNTSNVKRKIVRSRPTGFGQRR